MSEPSDGYSVWIEDYDELNGKAAPIWFQVDTMREARSLVDEASESARHSIVIDCGACKVVVLGD